MRKWTWSRTCSKHVEAYFQRHHPRRVIHIQGLCRNFLCVLARGRATSEPRHGNCWIGLSSWNPQAIKPSHVRSKTSNQQVRPFWDFWDSFPTILELKPISDVIHLDQGARTCWNGRVHAAPISPSSLLVVACAAFMLPFYHFLPAAVKGECRRAKCVCSIFFSHCFCFLPLFLAQLIIGSKVISLKRYVVLRHFVQPSACIHSLSFLFFDFPDRIGNYHLQPLTKRWNELTRTTKSSAEKSV